MKQFSALLLVAYAAGALAAVEPYGKCGGDPWTGETTCTSGFTCVFSNQWYSQCLPGTGGTVTTTKSTTTSSKTTTKTSSGATTIKTTTSSSKTTTKAVTTTTGGGTPPPTGFPASAGTTAIPTFKLISGTFDGGMLRWERNPDVCLDQTEGGEAGAMFVLEAGAHLKNAIIGGSQAEGVHCRGPCTIENVWHLNVCEDATTFKQTSGTSYVIGGGAQGADDKILQFNGRGTVSIDGFYARNYGKVIRNCGDCTGNGGPRHIIIKNVNAAGGGTLCGINTNYGDTCRISNSCQAEGKTCELYKGVEKGSGSSTKLSSGPDNISCWVTNPTC